MTDYTPQIAAVKREFRERLEALFGARHGAQSALARAYGIGDRRVREYLAEPPARWAPVPDWLLSALRAGVMARREIGILGPEPGSTASEARDEGAYNAIAPAIDAINAAGTDAGWHGAEIAAAILSRVTEIMVDAAGPRAARETLQQALDAVDNMPHARAE